MFIKYLTNYGKTGIMCYHRHYSNRNMLKLKERGMFEDIFPDNAANVVTDLMNSRPQTVYAGFDPTANSLHVGNLLVLINLLHWQRGGHQTIALVGGATAKIGDPSGRNTEREELATKFIDENIYGLCKNITTIFSNHEKYQWSNEDPLKPVRILNNESWYKIMNPVELIGSAGRHLRMGTLLSRTSVQSRLQSPSGMSFTEFSYQLFQAYDWFHLFKNHNCSFQIGGKDQMGNIMSGHELISKACKKPAYGLTLPLVKTEIGDKFGKSAGNAIWLSEEKTSAFSFYQFWMRQPDLEVENFLKLFTFDTIGSISDLMRQHREKPELRLPQRRLADQVTLLVHGEEGLAKAKKASEALFDGNVVALGEMNVQDVSQLFHGATVVDVLSEAGQSVLDLAMKTGCFPTKQDALRIISAGGFYINQQRVNNPSEVINLDVHRSNPSILVICLYVKIVVMDFIILKLDLYVKLDGLENITGMLSSALLNHYLLYLNRNVYLQKIKCIQWMNEPAHPQEPYCPTPVEHVANILTHGIWIIPSIAATLELIKRSSDGDQMLSALVYGATLILLFSVSTSFHCVFYCNRCSQLKDVLHRCDRAMIYVFIAGSYFPWLTLEKLPHEGWASQMQWIVWFLAVAGITYQQIFHEKYKMLETIFYFIMGLGPVLPIISEHTFKGTQELAIGGLLYVIGIIFFKSDGVLPFAHAIWHLFVVFAAYFHYYAILNYLYPLPTE